MRYLLLSLIALSGCGGGGSGGASVSPGLSGPGMASITLTARITGAGVQTHGGFTAPGPMQVAVIQSLTGTAGLSQASRAVIYYGSISCNYDRPANGTTYQLVSGSCVGGFVAGDVITIAQGESLVLTLATGFATQDQTAQADFVAQF
jgi:hypothetical protein